jgi:hypothetical protein
MTYQDLLISKDLVHLHRKLVSLQNPDLLTSSSILLVPQIRSFLWSHTTDFHLFSPVSYMDYPHVICYQLTTIFGRQVSSKSD